MKDKMRCVEDDACPHRCASIAFIISAYASLLLFLLRPACAMDGLLKMMEADRVSAAPARTAAPTNPPPMRCSCCCCCCFCADNT